MLGGMKPDHPLLEGRPPWPEQWQRSTPYQRQRIQRAARRGERLGNPRDAALAAGWIARQRRLLRWVLPAAVVLSALNVVVIVAAASLGPTGAAWTAGCYLILVAAVGLSWWWQSRRYARVERHYRETGARWLDEVG